MLDWLMEAIDLSREHDIGFSVSWHARIMVFAWSVLIPLGIISARFFKILPRQKWPQTLDNKTWWTAHLTLQYLGGVMMIIAVVLIWNERGTRSGAFFHNLVGWSTIVLCGVQYIAGWLRGSKGGPTDLEHTGTIRGDHFDMTTHRRVFECIHKSLGYTSLLVAVCAVFSGLWLANAPHWMWISLIVWWCFVIFAFARLQKTRGAVDTYEAIWGPDKSLPGNQIKPIGWGIKKRGD